MPNLDEHLLHELKTKLEVQKNVAEKRIKELHAQDPFSNPDRVNDNASDDDEAYETSGHERMQSLIEELKHQVTETEEALKRMRDGTYGICSVCGKLIEPERLRVIPTTTLSVDCENT